MIQGKKFGLAGIALAAISSLFLMTTPAKAADYNGNCAGVPTSVTGNVFITDTSGCTITHAVTATGDITLNVGGVVNIKALTAGGNLLLEGFITSTTITGNVESTGSGSISLYGASFAMPSGTISTTNNTISVLGGTVQTNAISNSGSTITITSTGDLTTGALTDSGSTITLNATPGDLTTGAITNTNGNTILAATVGRGIPNQPPVGGRVEVDGAITATNGYVQVNAQYTVKVTSTVKTTNGGNILINAGNTLQTGAVSTSLGGQIDLKANTSNTSAGTFTIGGTGQANGVNGTITATGSGRDQLLPSSVVYVTNQGGITLAGTTKISVAGATTSDKAGVVILNAGSGNISIPAGTMSVSSTGGAGQLDLLATQVSSTGAVTMDASQLATVPATNHQINIAASTIAYGTSLTLNADGQATAAGPGLASLLPKGSISVSDNQSPTALQISTSIASHNGALAISGTGAITMSASGDNTQAQILANPISIGGTIFTIRSQGHMNHGVTINNPVLTGATGLTLSSSTSVSVDASGSSTWGTNPAGGNITANLDPAVLSSPTFTFNASGNATSGASPGGSVSLNSANMQLGASSKATITANGSGTGAGANGGSISLVSNGTAPIGLGTGNGQFSLSATATGSAANGGSIVVQATQATVTETATTLNMSGVGSTANGGTLILSGNQLALSVAAPIVITSNAGTTGNGGNISLIEAGTASINFGTDNGQVSLSAEGSSTGLGGAVTVTGLANSTPAIPVAINNLVLVNGGSSLTSGFDGSIRVNGVLCQQWLTGTPAAPSYWDCVNPTSPGSEVIVPQTIPTLKSAGAFGASNVQLYVMSDVKAWQSFFAAQANPGNPTNLIGFYGLNTINSPNFVTAVFSNVVTDAGGDETANTILPSTTANQVGNQLDSIFGGISQATAWQTAYTQDTTSTGSGFINGTPCGSVFLASTCSNPAYSGFTNWQIFEALYASTPAAIFADQYEKANTDSGDPQLENALVYLPTTQSQMVAALSPVAACSTSITGSFPDGQFWFCAAEANDKSAPQGALNALEPDARSNSATGLATTNSTHLFFVFDDLNNYWASCNHASGGAPFLPCTFEDEIPPGSAGYTYNIGGNYYSVVFVKKVDQQNIDTSLANNMAHEAGHQLDHLYASVLGTNQFASEVQGLFALNLTDPAKGDWAIFNASTQNQCASTNSIFAAQQGPGFIFICSSITTVAVQGTPHAGDVLTVQVFDVNLPGGVYFVNYPVTATDVTMGLGNIAKNIAAQISNDPVLQVIKAPYNLGGPPPYLQRTGQGAVSATSSGTTITITSTSISADGTQYEVTASQGATENLAIQGDNLGTGPLNNPPFSGNNQAVLSNNNAWGYFFTPSFKGISPYYGELFAEETAFINSREGGNHSPDAYFQQGFFVCTRYMVQYLEEHGKLPPKTGTGSMPTQCYGNPNNIGQ
jgi:hypothetical protein